MSTQISPTLIGMGYFWGDIDCIRPDCFSTRHASRESAQTSVEHAEPLEHPPGRHPMTTTKNIATHAWPPAMMERHNALQESNVITCGRAWAGSDSTHQHRKQTTRLDKGTRS